MRFKNKLLKNIIRYTKEKGLYINFKENINKCFINYTQFNNEEINEKILLKDKEPYALLTKIGVEQGDSYYSPYIMYMYENNKEEYIKLFEKFLTSKKIKTLFQNNIDENFITNAVKAYTTNGKIIKEENKLNFLYENIPAPGFIMHAFRWMTANTPNFTYKKEEGKYLGEQFWREVNDDWTNTFSEYITKKYND